MPQDMIDALTKDNKFLSGITMLRQVYTVMTSCYYILIIFLLVASLQD